MPRQTFRRILIKSIAKADTKIAAKAAESEKAIAEIRATSAESVKAVAKDTAKELVAALGGKADAKTDHSRHQRTDEGIRPCDFCFTAALTAWCDTGFCCG